LQPLLTDGLAMSRLWAPPSPNFMPLDFLLGT
jgi:hypothetical protein